jgi:hypothetical protein
VSLEEGEVLFVEDLRDEAHAGADRETVATAAGCDSSAFLTSMLERVKTVEGEPGYVFAWSVDPKDATGFVRIVRIGHHKRGKILHCSGDDGLLSIRAPSLWRQSR